MAGLTFVLGGTRSGKSAFAENLARARAKSVIYLATADASDDEMRERIKIHQVRRDTTWKTIETPVLILPELERYDSDDPAQIILLDCLTVWLNNLIVYHKNVEEQTAELLRRLRKLKGGCIIVSCEIGLGLVPEQASTRAFRDALGTLHQAIAAIADQVYLVVAGLPITLKGERQ